MAPLPARSARRRPDRTVLTVDSLIECRWLAPVRPAPLLSDHALAIDGERIVAVLPVAQARRRFEARERTVLDRHLVTPGLVNAHTHASMTLLRGVGDDLPLQRWLRERIWPLEQALVDEDFVYDGARLAALEMLRAGVTTCSDMYFHPHACARGLRSVGMRAVLGIIAIEMATRYAADADDYLRQGLAARDALRDDPLVSFTVAPHAPYTVSDATLRRCALLAEELDLPLHIHVHETDGEIAESLRAHGLRPLARLDRLGLATERLIAVHAVHLSAAEIDLLAARGASVVHCPVSNLKLASGIAPAAALAAAGVNLALGTDGAASNNRLDILDEMRLAALLAKGGGDAAVLPAAQVLEYATLNGARALGLERRIGSIEVGKDADLVAFDLGAAETMPVYDPVSHLVYACGRENVSDVWVGGVPVVRRRQAVCGIDPDSERELSMKIAAWQNRTQACLGAER